MSDMNEIRIPKLMGRRLVAKRLVANKTSSGNINQDQEPSTVLDPYTYFQAQPSLYSLCAPREQGNIYKSNIQQLTQSGVDCEGGIHLNTWDIVSIWGNEGCECVKILADTFNDSNHVNNLISVNLPNVWFVGQSAFGNCLNLKTVSLQNANSIGQSIFNKNTNLDYLELPLMTKNMVDANAEYWNIPIGCVVSCMTTRFTLQEEQDVQSGYQIWDVAATSEPSPLFEYDGRTIVNILGDKTLSEHQIIVENYASTISDEVFQTMDSRYPSKLVEIHSETITSINEGAFANCYSLKVVDMPNLQVIDDGAFWDCTDLDELNCPNVVSIGAAAFAECQSLSKVSSSSIYRVGGSAFQDCEMLSVFDSQELKYIGEDAFQCCGNLSQITLDNVITIGARAFQYCESLTKVKLDNVVFTDDPPSGCEYLGNSYPTDNINGIFTGCTSLSMIDLQDNDIYSQKNLPYLTWLFGTSEMGTQILLREDDQEEADSTQSELDSTQSELLGDYEIEITVTQEDIDNGLNDFYIITSEPDEVVYVQKGE